MPRGFLGGLAWGRAEEDVGSQLVAVSRLTRVDLRNAGRQSLFGRGPSSLLRAIMLGWTMPRGLSLPKLLQAVLCNHLTDVPGLTEGRPLASTLAPTLAPCFTSVPARQQQLCRLRQRSVQISISSQAWQVADSPATSPCRCCQRQHSQLVQGHVLSDATVQHVGTVML